MHEAFRAALEQWPRDGVPANPRAWLVSAGRFKAIDSRRRLARFDGLDGVSDAAIAVHDDGRMGRPGSAGRRSAAADLYLLPPGVVVGCAGGADASRGLRPDHRRDRAGVRDAGADAGAAHRPGEGQDSGREDPVRGARAGGPRRTARLGVAGDLPRLQRGLCGVVGRVGDAARSVGGGDPRRAAARGAAARAGGDRSAGADAAARLASRGAGECGGRPGAAERPGSIEVGSRADRGRRAARRAGAGGADTPVPTRYRRRSRPCTPRRRAPRRPTGARSSACTTC